MATLLLLTNISKTVRDRAISSKFLTHRVVEEYPMQRGKIANLISKLNFYKLIPYPMDNSLSGRRRPARQTSEKDVLCLHRQTGP